MHSTKSRTRGEVSIVLHSSMPTLKANWEKLGPMILPLIWQLWSQSPTATAKNSSHKALGPVHTGAFAVSKSFLSLKVISNFGAALVCKGRERKFQRNP